MSWSQWNGELVKQRTQSALSRANMAALEAVGSAADQQVPLDEGTLLRSKYIEVDGEQGLISYGGGSGTGHPRVPYAVRWHENSAKFQHGRKKRYLADPVNQVGPKVIMNAYKKELKRAW